MMKDDVRMEEQDKRLEWVAPTIKEWDIVSETQSSFEGLGSDNSHYS